jgi:chaperonin cofactor prefoldin
MKAMRSTWTDSRLDDLNGRVDSIADEVRALRRDVRDLRSEFGSLQRTMIQIGGGLIGTLVIGMLGLIGTQL